MGGTDYSAGNGISISSNTISNTAGMYVTETGASTSATPINADMLEGKTLNNLFKYLYPVGAIYQNTTNTNPSTIITGTTWTLRSSVALASEHVFGNEYNLGISNSSGIAGLAYDGSQGYTTLHRTAYGVAKPDTTGGSGITGFGNTTTGSGVVTKTQTGAHPEYSGLIADTITIYTWERTA